MDQHSRLMSQRIKVADNIAAIYEEFYERGWTDGLPVIPPTEENVRAMVAAVKRDPQEVVAVLAPRSASATVERIAINAVMAGCLPEYLPVVIAAVEAIAEEKFNLLAVQDTTHPCATLIVVNGPIAEKLKLNSKGNAFGPGFRANATIGRALRLVMLNVGGGIPISVDKATYGMPGKYTYCVAENESESPWVPLHVERGFKPEDSTVTVFAAEDPHNINDHASVTGKGVLMTAAATMTTAGNNNLTYLRGDPILAMGPEHAATVAADGFSKDKIKQFLFEEARLALSKLSPENVEYRRGLRETYGEFTDSEFIPLTARKEDIVIMVVGGPGKHSCFIPTFALSDSVTKPIRT